MARIALWISFWIQIQSLTLAQDSSSGSGFDYSDGDLDFEDGENSAVCYFPAGNVAYGNVPCDPNAEVSICCGDREHCLANGLCAVGDTSDGLGGFLNSGVEFARGSCTDPTWEDPTCFQHCLSCELADATQIGQLKCLRSLCY